MKERLQKILSARGICSRRKAEEYLDRSLVKVNGILAKVGDKADPSVDRIEVDGRVLEERQEMLYFLMNKRVGVETSNVSLDSPRTLACHDELDESIHARMRGTRDDTNPLTVRDLLPKHLQGKIYPVGRLDKDTSGLLLLTNDGVLAYRLTHPKFDHEKEYEVTTEVEIFDGSLHKLKKGVMISGDKTKPAHIERLGPSKFNIALTEGKNRQIRRMCQKVGAPVKHLKRVRIVTLKDPRLAAGEIRELTNKEREDLLKAVGLSLQVRQEGEGLLGGKGTGQGSLSP